MKKNLIIFAAIVLCAVAMSSCGSLSVVPQAINTINAVSLSELNLDRKDYIVQNTLTAEATVVARMESDEIEISDPNGEFSLKWEWDKKAKKWEIDMDKVNGIVRLGYMDNDYRNELFDIEQSPYPHWIVRRLACYRIINAAKVAGADGIIEPIISVSVEQGGGRHTIIYKATVSGKAIKIKPDTK